jgi:hypothetical protein
MMTHGPFTRIELFKRSAAHSSTPSTMTTYHGPHNPHPRPGEAGIIIYGYVPSLSLAIPGVITFALALLVNLYYLRKYKGFKSFHTLLVIGSVSTQLTHACFVVLKG